MNETKNPSQQEWIEKFDKEFPAFIGVGAQFPIFNETPNRNHIVRFITQQIEASYERGREDMKAETLFKIKDGKDKQFEKDQILDGIEAELMFKQLFNPPKHE